MRPAAFAARRLAAKWSSSNVRPSVAFRIAKSNPAWRTRPQSTGPFAPLTSTPVRAIAFLLSFSSDARALPPRLAVPVVAVDERRVAADAAVREQPLRLVRP